MKRNDYDVLFDTIYNSCHSISKCKYEFSLKKTLFFNIGVLFKLIKNIKIFTSLDKGSFIGRVYLYVTSVYCLNVLEKIVKCYKFKYLVTFADMQPVDNILVQYSKNKAITTITLQHGLYIDYSFFRNVNMVNYMNVTSDYFLSWGRDTKALINKYSPGSRVVICGKPIPDIDNLETADYFTVIFDQNLFHEFNKKLRRLRMKYLKSWG